MGRPGKGRVPWEWAWFLSRGNPRKAFRRRQRGGAVWRGMRIAYPTPAELTRTLAPYFAPTRCRPLGFVLPPSYASGWLERRPRLLAALTQVERAAQRCSPWPALSDHYIFEARRLPCARLADSLMPSLLDEERPGRFGSLVGKVASFWYRLTGKHRYDRFQVERVLDLRLSRDADGAQSKVVLRTGSFFASCLDAKLIQPDARDPRHGNRLRRLCVGRSALLRAASWPWTSIRLPCGAPRSARC